MAGYASDLVSVAQETIVRDQRDNPDSPVDFQLQSPNRGDTCAGR